MCKLCTETISAVQIFVKGWDDEEKALARKVCNKIPGFGEICENFVDMGINYVEKTDPQEACKELQACK